MLTFQVEGKNYRGTSALDIVRAMEGDTEHYPHRGRSIRQFLLWSLERLCDHLPPRELDLSDRLEDAELALSYLYLRDEYGIGKLFTRMTTGTRRIAGNTVNDMREELSV